MQTLQNPKQPKSRSVQYPGNHGLDQILETARFEMHRGIRKTVIAFVFLAILAVLNYIMVASQLAAGVPKPENPATYAASFMNFFNFAFYTIVVAYGGGMLVRDFEKLTGNLLFPKISRRNLLLGRMLANCVMLSVVIASFYGFIAMFTAITYGTIPATMFLSLSLALLFGLATLTFSVMMSAITKTAASAMVLSLLILNIGFGVIALLLTQLGIEPVVSLYYYSSLLTMSFNMPAIRYTETTMQLPQGGTMVNRQYLTPSIEVGLVGMLCYVVLMLAIIYAIYKRRQLK